MFTYKHYIILFYSVLLLIFGTVYINRYWIYIKEGFESHSQKWPEDLVKRFIDFQHIINPNIQFDMKIIQQQASISEAESLLQNGFWPWTPEVIQLYTDAIQHNVIIRTLPGDDIKQAQSIYNQSAIMIKLSYNRNPLQIFGPS